MPNNDDIRAKFSSVISSLTPYLETVQYSPGIEADLASAQIEATNLLRRVCGETSDHYRAIKNFAVFSGPWRDQMSRVPSVLGCVRAAESDYNDGFIRDLRAEVRAEVLDDLLEESTGLLQRDEMPGAAALIAVAVLEDTLRRLCVFHDLAIESDAGLGRFNTALKQAGAYSKPMWRQIQAWTDVRNELGHGNLDALDTDAAKRMITGISEFVVLNQAKL